jgi:hypothetical protein
MTQRNHVIYSFSTKVKLGDPLPGYTGTIKRVVAANIFG